MSSLENIHNMVPRLPEVPTKPVMYRSLHLHQLDLAGSTFGAYGTTQPLGAASLKKQEYATMGRLAEYHRKDPSQFLKRDKCAKKKTGSFTYPKERKETVPRREERPVSGIATNKNFITSNAVEAILAVPNRKENLEVDYLRKEDYGMVPKYLTQVKDEIARENNMINTFVREQMGLKV
ncbi:unnamed protein product, partial [Choristocarpus tenellus]